MLSRMPALRDYEFENFTELSAEVQDNKFTTQTPLDYKVVVDPTALSEHESFEDFYFSRTFNNAPRDYEISFEAKFMEQHEKAFKKQTENFMESSFKMGGEKNISFQSQEIFGENLQFGTFTQDEESLLRFEQSVQFFKTIQNEEKLVQLMQFIYRTVPKEIAAEFVYLASIAWSRHSANNQVMGENQISDKAAKLAQEEYEKLFDDQRIKFLNLKIVSNSQLNSKFLVKDAFKSYLEFFFATVVLVGEQYFENQYGEFECPKRERVFRLEDDFDGNQPSSADNSTFGIPTKKLHFY